MTKAIPEISSTNLQMQIEGITNFDRELTPGKAAKGIMGDLGAKSRDLYMVKPSDITVLPGYNPRVQNRAYFEGVETLAQGMVKHGYMQDKPLAVYSAKIDGEDKLVLQDGHRRHAAVLRAIELGAPIKVVPCVLKERTENTVDLTLALLHSNEGEPFTTYEKAILAKRLKKAGQSNSEIASEMKCTTAFVGQLLTLAGAPTAIADLVKNGNLSATEAHKLMMEHGAEAADLATGAMAEAKSKGKTKITAKDIAPKDMKAKRAKKHAYDLYRLLKKYRSLPAVEKVIEDRDFEVIDTMLADIEAVPKVKEPKEPKAPKAAKAPKTAKVPLAKKIAGAAKVVPIKVKAASAGTKEAAKQAEGFFDKMAKQQQEEKAAKEAKKANAAQAKGTVSTGRRTDR